MLDGANYNANKKNKYRNWDLGVLEHTSSNFRWSGHGRPQREGDMWSRLKESKEGIMLS